MAHSSGISLSEELIQQFKTIDRSGDTRFIKAVVGEDSISFDVLEKGTSNFDADLDLVLPHLDDNEPCLILFRTNSRNGIGYKWILFTYIPDTSKVRQKMIYSSTKVHFKEIFKTSIQSEVCGTTKSDFGRSGYNSYLTHKSSPNPLTEVEKIKQREREYASDYKRAAPVGMAGLTDKKAVNFPTDESVITALKDMTNKGKNYVKLGLNEACTNIILEETKDISLDELSSNVPIDKPAFHYLRSDYSMGSIQKSSYIFVFSCPDGSGDTKSTPVKQRMMYSTSKNSVVKLMKDLNVEINLKIEINSPKDIDVKEIQSQLKRPSYHSSPSFNPTSPYLSYASNQRPFKNYQY
ncbi:Twinfilin [Entamoeba marina]